MSAASKLRAEVEWRDEGGDSGPYDIHERNVGQWLYDAREQIAAVVEAAEPFARVSGSADAAMVAEGYRLIAALSALDEVLA